MSRTLYLFHKIWRVCLFDKRQLCYFKGNYLFHRTSCNNFCLESAVLNVSNHFQPFNFRLAILQQQLQLFIKHSKFFRRAIVDICTCKGDFGNSYFLQRAALFVQGTVVFGNSYCQEDLFQASNFCKDNIFFSKHH